LTSSTNARGFFSQTRCKAFTGKRRFASGKQIWRNSAVSEMLKLKGKFFLPSTVRRQVFSWSRKFGEIDPLWI